MKKLLFAILLALTSSNVFAVGEVVSFWLTGNRYCILDDRPFPMKKGMLGGSLTITTDTTAELQILGMTMPIDISTIPLRKNNKVLLLNGNSIHKGTLQAVITPTLNKNGQIKSLSGQAIDTEGVFKNCFASYKVTGKLVKK